MKTKQIPALIMLIAGFVVCIVSYINGYGFLFLVRTLLWVLPGFYVLGLIIKVVFDRNLSVIDDDDFTADDLGFTDGEILEDDEETTDDN